MRPSGENERNIELRELDEFLLHRVLANEFYRGLS